ncbi:MAG: hypothetical protein L0Y60_17045 [Beijerinckiaceae bacterium]|nr:hypothetical protein [Beijerinckiaceae bacterium]
MSTNPISLFGPPLSWDGIVVGLANMPDEMVRSVVWRDGAWGPIDWPVDKFLKLPEATASELEAEGVPASSWISENFDDEDGSGDEDVGGEE